MHTADGRRVARMLERNTGLSAKEWLEAIVIGGGLGLLGFLIAFGLLFAASVPWRL
jgi:hypothetical protein